MKEKIALNLSSTESCPLLTALFTLGDLTLHYVENYLKQQNERLMHNAKPKCYSDFRVAFWAVKPCKETFDSLERAITCLKTLADKLISVYTRANVSQKSKYI